MSGAASHQRPGGVVLFGPPTAGKDTVSAALAEADSRFGQLTKLKVGSGRTAGYRMASRTELDDLRRAGRIVLETQRYGNTYAVDRADLQAMREAGRVPVAHMGSIDHLGSFLAAVGEPWLCVLLWVPRRLCRERSLGRGDRDTSERLAAWDTALADLESVPGGGGMFHVLVRTDRVEPGATADRVVDAYGAGPREARSREELTAFLESVHVADR